MAGSKQPIDIVVANGRKHLTKEEIEHRRATEVTPCPDGIAPPEFLTPAQAERFCLLASQLEKIRIMGETDVEILARYVTAEESYEQAVLDLRAFEEARPDSNDLDGLLDWLDGAKSIDIRVERYAKLANSMARELGLTILSRCKLTVAPTEEPEKPKNKFASFG